MLDCRRRHAEEMEPASGLLLEYSLDMPRSSRATASDEFCSHRGAESSRSGKRSRGPNTRAFRRNCIDGATRGPGVAPGGRPRSASSSTPGHARLLVNGCRRGERGPRLDHRDRPRRGVGTVWPGDVARVHACARLASREIRRRSRRRSARWDEVGVLGRGPSRAVSRLRYEHTIAFVLYGRDPERAQIGALLEAARASRSGALVLRGEAGIGKSALLEDARERAGDMQVLAARGVESEAELPFAGLHQLLRPALGHVERLPPPQAAAIRLRSRSRGKRCARALPRLRGLSLAPLRAGGTPARALPRR